ncbi:MAG: NAD(P)/FAD-dependent oxidoreductase [Hyphomicrobium sp.]|uniref:FAD-dependent oxidoreductase n=1 Tax=Hyphomicrobium sp. TaxID=82 RepID=UPI003567647E
MVETDVAIVGAGLAGSLAATMLGRRGVSVALIDPFEHARPDFRCEKIEDRHADSLAKAGVLDEILPAARRYENVWVARLGRLAEIKPIVEYGIAYGDFVNGIRRLIPSEVVFVHNKVASLSLTPERQTLTLLSGDQISARLIIGATGLGAGFLDRIDMHRREISKCHSLSIGFDADSENLPFDSLTYFGEDPSHRVAYITLFPLASGLRVNIFTYHDLDDPWVRRLRISPMEAIAEALPRLERLTGRLRVRGAVKIRPVDLIATENAAQPGIALVGDAFSTACPVSGTGASKALLDTERLCNVHVPNWLSTPGMDADKIAAFYRDPLKTACDAHSLKTSLFAKRSTLGQTALWSAFRWGCYAGSLGRNLVEHRRFPRMPANSALQSEMPANH